MKKKTGAKIAKGAASVLLGLALAFGAGANVAEAAVHPSVIIEAQQEEVKAQREYEVACVEDYLTSTNYNGYRVLNNETIRKCMELSNLLNAYDPDFYTYTNTTPFELLGLDINDIYADYVHAVHSEEANAFGSFIDIQMNNKPALDATIQLSTGVVSADIKQKIGEIIANQIAEAGSVVTEYPYVIANNGTIYVLAGINGTRQIFTIDGMSIPGVYETVKALDDRHRMVVDNLRGDSPDYPNPIAYNGINSETGESVWLAFGDSEIKDLIEEGLTISDSLNNDPSISVEFNYSDCLDFPTDEDLELFAREGFDPQEYQGVPITSIYIVSEIDYDFMLGQ